mmetsp:Transcript_29677/g.72296  ORF Transcript_29677/g.72296 Transcript_29677/m.72296 type:complete len:453 (+) Transcript_29677:707-2065(+)
MGGIVEFIQRKRSEPPGLAMIPTVQQILSMAMRWVRVRTRMTTSDTIRVLLPGSRRRRPAQHLFPSISNRSEDARWGAPQVGLGGVVSICCTPASVLLETWSSCHACVAFSATLEPIDFHQELLGFKDLGRGRGRETEGHEDDEFRIACSGRKAGGRSGSGPGPGPVNKLGLIATTEVIRQPQVFQRTQQNAFIAAWICGDFQKRAEVGIPSIAELLNALPESHPGRYLVCVPSYSYMRALTRELDRIEGEGGGREGVRYVLAHNDGAKKNADAFGESIKDGKWEERFGSCDYGSRTTSEKEIIKSYTYQEAEKTFLDQIEAMESGAIMCVLGGRWSEGIDLPRGFLRGVVVVGLGMPPPNEVNQGLASWFDARMGRGTGFDYAYRFPGLKRIVQAAGRLIRSPEHYGTLILADHRWMKGTQRSLLPIHWRPKPCYDLHSLLRHMDLEEEHV